MTQLARHCVQEGFFPYRLSVGSHIALPDSSLALPKNEVPARWPGPQLLLLEKELGSATLTVAVLILFVGLILTALFLLVLAGLTLPLLSGLSALLALLELTGLSALLALVSLLTFLVHIVCHETFS